MSKKVEVERIITEAGQEEIFGQEGEREEVNEYEEEVLERER